MSHLPRGQGSGVQWPELLDSTWENPEEHAPTRTENCRSHSAALESLLSFTEGEGWYNIKLEMWGETLVSPATSCQVVQEPDMNTGLNVQHIYQRKYL